MNRDPEFGHLVSPLAAKGSTWFMEACNPTQARRLLKLIDKKWFRRLVHAVHHLEVERPAAYALRLGGEGCRHSRVHLDHLLGAHPGHAVHRGVVQLGEERDPTVGRALLSEILPKGLPFSNINKALKKKEISKLINEAFRRCGIRETVIFADKLMQAGFGIATRAVAESERAASLLGYSPDLIGAANWALGCMLAAFATPRGRWIGLVVFGPETSVGIVQLFFDQMVQQLASAAQNASVGIMPPSSPPA